MTFGTPEIQKQILLEIQQLNLNDSLKGSFEAPKTWAEDGVDQADVDAIYATLEGLRAHPYLLGIIGSWGDTLTPKGVLDDLRTWNQTANGNRGRT
jgi:hypothetical protein